mmetsp:Transcript_19088/g.55508  ORF Transcript_19088/g.55508 Transcript_19088/m.55508 type:complete len:212 (-) Transcript_19088:1096-1731(-)
MASRTSSKPISRMEYLSRQRRQRIAVSNQSAGMDAIWLDLRVLNTWYNPMSIHISSLACRRLAPSRLRASSVPSAVTTPVSQLNVRSADGKSASATLDMRSLSSCSTSPIPMSRVRCSLVWVHRKPRSPQNMETSAFSKSWSMSRFNSSNTSTSMALLVTLAMASCWTRTSPSPLNFFLRALRNFMGKGAKAAPSAESRPRNWPTRRMAAR